MIAYRTTWIVKQGRMQEALELLSAEIERTRKEGPQVRVYTPDLSPNVLVFEMASKSVEEHDAWWAEYDRTTPEAAAFWNKWYDVTDRSVDTSRWKLVEWR
jgi:benzoyl-CoA reductase/2-hydroxyglutaryl-CoA dehydratase subunit BcrC/BadD/HgdB